jgi:hypothetical protein
MGLIKYSTYLAYMTISALYLCLCVKLSWPEGDLSRKGGRNDAMRIHHRWSHTNDNK